MEPQVEPHVQVYVFVRALLAWSISVAVLWPVMFPWSRFAYRIWHGTKPIDEELEDELWWRAGYSSSLMFVVAFVMLLLNYATVDQFGVPSGPVHIVYYLVFLTLAAFIMHYCYYMEDFFQGLSLAVIYLYIPVALLFLFGRWNPVYQYVLTWLIEPKA
jgi:hypothetical protein